MQSLRVYIHWVVLLIQLLSLHRSLSLSLEGNTGTALPTSHLSCCCNLSRETIYFVRHESFVSSRVLPSARDRSPLSVATRRRDEPSSCSKMTFLIPALAFDYHGARDSSATPSRAFRFKDLFERARTVCKPIKLTVSSLPTARRG